MNEILTASFIFVILGIGLGWNLHFMYKEVIKNKK